MPPQETFVSRLPCELLDNIFLVAFAAEVSPITLSHVSSDWRNRIIHNSPSIWTRLYISLDHWNPGRIDYINCFITRSSPLPLSIIVDFGKITEQNAIPKARLGPQILSSLLQAASRWKILDTHGLFFRNTFFPPNIEFPLLEKLLITGTIGRKPVSAFGRAPKLWFLAASKFRPLVEHHFKVPWSQIRDARINVCDLFIHCTQMIRLETLHVLGMLSMDVHSFQICCLPTVLRLALHPENFHIVNFFRFNNIISLEIILDSWDSGRRSCLTPIIDRFVAVGHIASSLRHLSTSFFPSASVQFKQLLQQLPDLETLRLTCIWVRDETYFPHICACLFRDLSATGSTCLVPNLQKLTLRGAPYLDRHFQALMVSRGPSLHVSVIFQDPITNPGYELNSHEGYMYQTILYSWLTIRSHLQELRTSGWITIHVEGENQLLERWGPDLTHHHRSSAPEWAMLRQCVYYYSTDVPNYVWGENKWPPNVKILGVDELKGWGPVASAAEVTYMEAARALKEKYKEIGNLDQVKLEPF